MQSLAHKMELIDQDRLLRLQRAAKMGNIVHTKQGVFQSTPCSVCGFHHKLSLSLKKQAPCPATEVGMRYYGKHPKEKLLMEIFPLNRVLKASIQTIDSSEKVALRCKKSGSVSLPKVTKSNETENQELSIKAQLASASSDSRPKTSRGRQEDVNSVFDELNWNDVFLESQVSSSEDSSDADSKDQEDIDTMRRQLVREMFTQEEEALRYQLAKEKEKYYSDVRLVCCILLQWFYTFL